jgi:acyl-ACP thioesterase
VSPRPDDPTLFSDDQGRRFQGWRKVRLGDVTPSGRLRLDALTRYTQDVSDDDTTDAGLSPEPAWVVRRTLVEVGAPAVLAETIRLTTYCSGLGRRWAERHLSVVGDAGAAYEVSTLWICIDPVAGRPTTLTDEFLAIYGSSAGGHTVNARLTHPKPVEGADHRPWPLRVADFDTLNHVNNAAYWAVIEEDLAANGPSGPFRASVEYRDGIVPTDEVTVASADLAAGRCLWWLTGDGALAASALIEVG